jgi:hypothetical protein
VKPLFACTMLVGIFASVQAQEHNETHAYGRYDVAYYNYMLSCGGCHGLEGHSNQKEVPNLAEQVGYFLALQQGREYLVRLPNVAFCSLDDDALIDVLNLVLVKFAGSSVPRGFEEYTAREVSELRKRPLNEVNLSEYRNALVGSLIKYQGAPRSLLIYGHAPGEKVHD